VTDKDTEIRRGEHAQRLLDDDVLKEAFANLESDYLNAWRASRYNDTDGRERLWQAVQIVGKVQSHLNSMVMNSKLLKREIDDLAKPRRAA
jgi:hypothetical protein